MSVSHGEGYPPGCSEGMVAAVAYAPRQHLLEDDNDCRVEKVAIDVLAGAVMALQLVSDIPKR